MLTCGTDEGKMFKRDTLRIAQSFKTIQKLKNPSDKSLKENHWMPARGAEKGFFFFLKYRCKQNK